ncbi:MAG TPA: hypothetical protein PLB02_01160 [Thermoanaerobaculia bacterium]|nr:hypothetical protein [Thermoanaerobaculia bacterium]HQR65978.1 hypothetical protein [Thermoanaerobaculia bacterium]
MSSPRRLAPTLALFVLLLAPLTARAQWVFVARKALGKIQTLTQKESTGAPGYSVATVILTGKADKVYEIAVKTAQSSPKGRLTYQDPATHTLEFAAGGQVVGLRVSQVDSQKVQILIASAASAGKPDATPAAVEATLRVCKEMGATCDVVK